jgi:hypothetical protein
MALCGFRADNFRFGLLEGQGLPRILSLLEKIERGFAPEEAAEEDSAVIRGLRQSGLASARGGKLFLTLQGDQLLETCRSLARRPPSARP